jgi:anti-anti-sigma factor
LIAALNSSRVLDSVLPVFLSNETAVLRGIYLSPGGAVRTYPSLDPSRLPSGWSVDQDVRYQAALPRSPVRPPVVWTATHRALDSNEIVVSAVVPMTQRGRFDGALAIDVSLARLTSYLTSLASDPVAMAFIVDGNGQLVATSESGRGYLQDEAQPLQTAVPALQKVINDTRIGNGGAMVDAVLDRPSIVAYAPISVANWSLVLVAPLDTITSRMQTITARTTAIASETGLWSVIGTVIVMVGLGGLFSLTLQRQFMRPLGVLTRATRDIAAGTLRHIPVTSADEMGQLATAFNGMTDALQASRAEIVAANQRLERTVQERTSDLQLTVARLEESFAAQQTLLQTLHAVSTPVIPVVAGVLAMPLIGQFDAERAQHARQELLARIERERAHTVLLDVTGVPLIDTAAAQALLQTVAASRLLGAEVLLVGVTPEVAQTLVALGIDLAGLRTAIDLQSAIEQLLVRGPARRGAAVR